MCKCTSFHSPLPPGEGTGKGGFCPAQDLRGLGLQIIAPPSSFAPGRICRGSSLVLVVFMFGITFAFVFEFVFDSPNHTAPADPAGDCAACIPCTIREPDVRGSNPSPRRSCAGHVGHNGDRNPPCPLFQRGNVHSPLPPGEGPGVRASPSGRGVGGEGPQRTILWS